MKAFHISDLPLYEAQPPFTRLNKVIVDKQSCEAENLSVGLGIYRKGEKAEMHVHPDSEEVMMFTAGAGRMLFEDGRVIDLSGGVITYVPAGEKHKIENTGDRPLEFWFIYSPPGPEKGIRGWKVIGK